MKTRFLLAASGGSVGGTETYTTPGTYYWTAPVGVTTVDVTGQGGSSGTQVTWSTAVAYRYAGQGVYTFSANPPGSNLGTAVSISSVNTSIQGLTSQWQAITTSSSGAFYSGLTFYEYYYQSSTGNFFRNSNSYSGTYRRTGTVSIGTVSGSGNLTSSTSINVSASNIERKLTSTVFGTDSTAFGQTFPDNTSQATYSGITVTPGNVYTIVVGADQGADTAFVSFDYY